MGRVGNSPLSRGGGGELRRVGFPAKNGDRYGDSALITTQGKSLESPCEAPFLARKSNREQSYPKNTQSHDSSSTILESQSSTEAQTTKNAQPLESTFSQSHDFKENALLSSLRALLRKAWQSISAQADSKKAQNREALESTCEKTAENTKVDSRVVNSASAESVDCHAANTARNDDKNAFSLESTFENNATSKNADSSSATNLSELAKDSRISKETSPSGERYPLFSKETSHSKAKSSKEAKTPKPLICIPTYNESNNIAALLCEIFSRFPEIHALVIDDNSTDGTQEILNSLAHTYPHLHLLKRSGKLGLASAYIDGFSWGLKSGYSHFIQMDADFSHHPRYLAQTLANLPHFEVVINSRNIIGGGVLGWGLGRKILSRFGSLYARLWLGARVMDFTGGFNAYSARALSAIDLHSIKSSGYCFQIEMKYRAYKAGLRLLELPIIFEDRVAGKSKMSKTIVLEALWRTPLLRLRVKRAER